MAVETKAVNCDSQLSLETLLQALIVKDADGNFGINATITDAECDTLEYAVNCDRKMSFADMLRASIILDPCGKPSLRMFNSIPAVP